MDTKITEIEILLDKLNLLFGSIKNDGQIDKLELELLKRYVQQLHDKVQSFDLQKTPADFIQPVVKKEEPLVKNIVISPKEEQIIPEPVLPAVETKIEKVIEPKVDPIVEPIVEKITSIIPPEKVIPVKDDVPVIEKKEPPVVQPESKKKLIAQEEEEEDEAYNTGLNNKLFKDKKTLADKISSSKAKDIKSIIDLNEKLFFINKLFKGDKDAYEHSIKTLNGLSGLVEAERYINTELKNKFQWQDEAAIERLKEVVRTKFE